MKFKFVALLILAASLSMSAQVTAGAGGRVAYVPVTTTGQLGSYVGNISGTAAPSNYTLDWSSTGTTASACTFQGEGSSDAFHWYALTSPTDCSSASMVHIAYKPVIFFRINVLTYTQGDSSTKVSFNYTKGQ